MTKPKNLGLDLDALAGTSAHAASRLASDTLREMQGFSTAANSAREWLAENDIAAHAHRWQQANSIASLFGEMESQRAEEIRKLVNPYENIRKLLRPNASVRAAQEIAEQYENLMAGANVHLEAAQAYAKHLDHYRNIAKNYEASFRLPRAAEVARLLADIRIDVGGVADYARQHLVDVTPSHDLIASISQPWLREVEATGSATALLELQGLGSVLRHAQGFDDAITAALRMDLGDWRDRLSFPQAVFEDPVARIDFYVERGFNTSLTDFPEEAFQESLVLVGLDADTQDISEWPESMHAADAFEEAAFRRTNKCHNYLQRLERRLRQFIDEAMTAQYGAGWPRKRLAPQMLESWESKKSRAENGGLVFTTFIEAADFADYEAIICRKDHWREVFQRTFQRPESVRESFQRLYPIRLACMHARFVTKEDVLYVLAESMRLLNAIRN
jgi:hypothetical protein